MIVTPEFPEHWLQDPGARPSGASTRKSPGAGLHVPQLDFGIWLQANTP